MCGFCNVWVCVLVGFVMCGCFGNMCTCIYCVLYCLYCVFCIVSFMYIYAYLFCLYWCKDYCHRVTAQLLLVVVVVVVAVVFYAIRTSSRNVVYVTCTSENAELNCY